MNQSKPSPARPRRAAAPRACAALLLAASAACAVARPASAADAVPNLQGAAVTDLPGPPSAVASGDRSVLPAIRLKDGAVVLDSAVLLKVYVYAYTAQPVDDTAILTPNTQMIHPPAAVHATPGQAREIASMIGFARAHPRLLIRVDDIALDARVAQGGYYPIDNRLFIHDAGYYFDNSPYHYRYQSPRQFRHLHCEDPAVIRDIDRSIANFVHFDMDIACTVLGADAKSHALLLRIDEVRLRDAVGNVLIDRKRD